MTIVLCYLCGEKVAEYEGPATDVTGWCGKCVRVTSGSETQNSKP